MRSSGGWDAGGITPEGVPRAGMHAAQKQPKEELVTHSPVALGSPAQVRTWGKGQGSRGEFLAKGLPESVLCSEVSAGSFGLSPKLECPV